MVHEDGRLLGALRLLERLPSFRGTHPHRIIRPAPCFDLSSLRCDSSCRQFCSVVFPAYPIESLSKIDIKKALKQSSRRELNQSMEVPVWYVDMCHSSAEGSPDPRGRLSSPERSQRGLTEGHEDGAQLAELLKAHAELLHAHARSMEAAMANMAQRLEVVELAVAVTGTGQAAQPQAQPQVVDVELERDEFS